MTIPTSTKALVLRKSEPTSSKHVYHGIEVISRPIPALKDGEILVKVTAVAYNRRDLWIRLGQYPGIAFDSVMGADGVGSVIASSESKDDLLNQRVFFVPMRGWETDPDAPESEVLGILGGVRSPSIGTFSEYVVVERDQVILAPDHLDDTHLAAWPLGGLTAYRAAIVNGLVSPGQNILVTGAGGGVAIVAIQLCIAQGANVYVTSGSKEKIQKAVELGAKGGVSYKSSEWPTQLAGLLKKDGAGKIDAVIDSGGGDQLMAQVSKVLKNGGRVVCYGMTAGKNISMTMREVMRNQRLIGSTMGSHADLKAATAFFSKHRIIPVVSHVLDGLESADQGFEIMKGEESFGKIVLKVAAEEDAQARL